MLIGTIIQEGTCIVSTMAFKSRVINITETYEYFWTFIMLFCKVAFLGPLQKGAKVIKIVMIFLKVVLRPLTSSLSN